jgi:hypothetical protein
MQVVECFEIQTWDGGDRHNFKCYVATETEAKRWVNKNKHDIYVPRLMFVFDTLEEAEENELAAVRKRVIERLSPLERKAMGV